MAPQTFRRHRVIQTSRIAANGRTIAARLALFAAAGAGFATGCRDRPEPGPSTHPIESAGTALPAAVDEPGAALLSCRERVTKCDALVAQRPKRPPTPCTKSSDCTYGDTITCRPRCVPRVIHRSDQESDRQDLAAAPAVCKTIQDDNCYATLAMAIPSCRPYWAKCDHGRCAPQAGSPPP